MFKKLLLNFMIILLNPAFELTNGADISQSSKVTRMDDSSVTENTWQPIVQTLNWLPPPTALTPTQSMSTATSAARASWQNLNLRKHLPDTAKYKYYNSTDTQISHNNIRRHSGNYGKKSNQTLTSSILPSPPSTSINSPQSIENFQSKSHDYSLLINNNNKTNNSIGRDKYISNNHHHHHLEQPYAIRNNKKETVYPPTQIPKEILQQVQEYQMPSSHHAKNKNYSISTQLDLNHLANMEEHSELTNSTSSVTYRHYSHSAKDMTTHKNNAKNTLSTMNFEVKTNSGYTTDLPTGLNYFKNNENLIANEITNVKNHQHQNHYHPALRDSDVKSHKSDDMNPITATKSHSTDTDANAGADDNVNISNENLLIRTFKNAKELYDIIKDNILSKKDKSSDHSGSYENTDEGDDYEDITNDDNDLQILNASSHHEFKDTSTAVAAAIVEAVEKLDSLNMKNMLFSLASTGKVKGRKRQIDKGHTKYTLIEPPSQAGASLSTSLQDTNTTQNEAVEATFQLSPINDTQKRVQLRKFSTKSIPASSSKAFTSTLLNAPTSKGLAVVSSGRKIKKLKKKFEKFLLPLVLAYKLKFMALIPLLIGGLILLVGSTGLAGFFFALFAAVMSVKTDHDSHYHSS